jgi:cbb3-type cytochrome oxidase subunit 1
MLKRNRWFITLALVYALLAGLIGVLRLAAPGWLAGDVPRIHGHLMLLGFIAMMIYGIGLHVLPRFAGRPLYSERLADVQFMLANLGLWGMLYGWLAGAQVALTVGAGLTWLGMALFTVNIALTVRLFGPRI